MCVSEPFGRLVPHVDKAPIRLVTSNFLPVENPTHPTAHAPERASVYILGQFFKMRNEHVLKTEKICRTFFSISLSNIAVIGNFDFNNFFNVVRF